MIEQYIQGFAVHNISTDVKYRCRGTGKGGGEM